MDLTVARPKVHTLHQVREEYLHCFYLCQRKTNIGIAELNNCCVRKYGMYISYLRPSESCSPSGLAAEDWSWKRKLNMQLVQ